MSQKQNEILPISPAEAAVAHSMAEQVLAPGKPGMVFVDGGCSNWPYAYAGGSRSDELTSRDFNGAQYIALDGGKSSSATTNGMSRAMDGWDDKKDYAAEAVSKIQVARDRGIDGHYMRADLKELPFSNESIDELFLADVILAPGMYSDSMQSIVEEAKRVVKAGGMFVLKETEVLPARMQSQGYEEQNHEYEFDRGRMGLNGLRPERALQKLLKANGFDFEVHDKAQDAELVGKLNDIYRTSDSVKGDRGAYILARKLPEITRTPKARRGLGRFLGRKALA